MRVLSWRWGEIVVESYGFCRFLKKLGGAGGRLPRACVMWPFMIVRTEEEYLRPWLANHERIHLRQQGEMLVVGAMLLHVVEWFVGRVVLRKSRAEAYFWMSMEQEAYLNQHDAGYLGRRKRFAHFGHMLKKRRFRVTDVPGEIEFY